MTFCSAWCVEEWRLRSDPGYIREKVLERDRGVCASCGVDCLQAERQLKRLRGAARLKALLEWGLRAGSRKSLWDADHIVPVVEGGGECDLQNIRTLCLKCHRAATAELRQRRLAATRACSRLLMQQRLQITHNRLRHNFVALRRRVDAVLLH